MLNIGQLPKDPPTFTGLSPNRSKMLRVGANLALPLLKRANKKGRRRA